MIISKICTWLFNKKITLQDFLENLFIKNAAIKSLIDCLPDDLQCEEWEQLLCKNFFRKSDISDQSCELPCGLPALRSANGRFGIWD